MNSRRSTRRLKRQRTISKNARRSSLPNTLVAALEYDSDTNKELLTDDDDISNKDPGEILESIQEQKDIISNVKSRPWPMKKKLKVLNAARRFVEKYEGRLSKTKSYSEAGKEVWRKMKVFSNNVCSVLTLWDMRIKTIESYFGSSVASYFLFLRWLVQINVVMGVITTAFLVIPEILVGDRSVSYKQVPENEKATAWDLSTVWSLGGHIQHSVFFYGYYTNQRVVGDGYRLPLAYFLVGMATFAYSFVALLRKMAKNSRLIGAASSDEDFAFSWRLFSSWDYMIGNSETAENKSAAIATAIREAIVEEQEKEKQQNSRQKLRIFLRIIANVLVLLLLAGSLYSIQFAVSRAQSFADVDREITFWEQNEVSIVVTLVTMITPSLFEVIGSMENYHPRNTLRIQLARILMLYLGNLYSLMIGLLGHVAEATAQNTSRRLYNLSESNVTQPFNMTQHVEFSNRSARSIESSLNATVANGEFEASNNLSAQRTECWETYVGQELMKLSIIDLISTILTILIVDFIRALFVRYVNVCCCWDLENKFPEYGEFKIAENVLHLIYNQGITWVGSFFSPLLPSINIIKLTLMMYIRSWAVLTCNVPHQRVFRASRSNNFYLAMLLFMLFLSLLPTVWVIVRHQPSSCGPFSNREWMHTIISETLEKDVPSWLREGLSHITTPVVILPVILLLLMVIYYLQAIARSAKEANSRLKLQLHYERKEGKKNIFQLGAGKRKDQKSSNIPCRGTINESSALDFSLQLTPIKEDVPSSPAKSLTQLKSETESTTKVRTKLENQRESGVIATPPTRRLSKSVSKIRTHNRHHRARRMALDDIPLQEETIDLLQARAARRKQDLLFDSTDLNSSAEEQNFAPRARGHIKSRTPRRTIARYLEVEAELTSDKEKSSRRCPSPSTRLKVMKELSGSEQSLSTVCPTESANNKFCELSPSTRRHSITKSKTMKSDSPRVASPVIPRQNESPSHQSPKQARVVVASDGAKVLYTETGHRYVIVEDPCSDIGSPSRVVYKNDVERTPHRGLVRQYSTRIVSSSDAQEPSETESVSPLSYAKVIGGQRYDGTYGFSPEPSSRTSDSDVLHKGRCYQSPTIKRVVLSPSNHRSSIFIPPSKLNNPPSSYIYISENPTSHQNAITAFNPGHGGKSVGRAIALADCDVRMSDAEAERMMRRVHIRPLPTVDTGDDADDDDTAFGNKLFIDHAVETSTER